MLVSSEGFIIKHTPYSDTSIILKVITRDFGLLSFLVKGAKSKSKSQNGNILRSMNLVELHFYHRENKSLKNIKSAQLIFAPDAQQFGIYKSAILMFMTELIGQTITEESNIDEEKFGFIKNEILALRDQSLDACFYLRFMTRFTELLGIGLPENLRYHQEIKLLANNQSIALCRIDRQAIFQIVESHYAEQIHNFKSIQSLQILESIFTSEINLH